MPKSATTSTPRIPTQEEYKSLCRLISTLNTLKYCDIKASDKQAYFDALWKSKDELENVLQNLLLVHDISAPRIARMLQYEITYISEQANPLYLENPWVDDALAKLKRVQSLADRQPRPLRGRSIHTTEADDSALPTAHDSVAEPAEDQQGSGGAAGQDGTIQEAGAGQRADARRDVSHHKPWEPPESHVRVSTICGDSDTGQGDTEYQKDGKSPPRTTVQQWADRDDREVIHDPATNENCYPKNWVLGCLKKWSPRKPRKANIKQ